MANKKPIFYPKTPIGAIQKVINDVKNKNEIDGDVQFVDATGGVWVKLFGANNFTKVNTVAGVILSPGDHVFLRRDANTGKWTVFDSYADRSVSSSASGGLTGTSMGAGSISTYAPTNFASHPEPNGVFLTWSPPGPNGTLSYEIESADDNVETNSLIILVAGSNTFVQTTTLKYFRIRSIASDFTRSGWTVWISDSPLSSVGFLDVIQMQVFGA